MKNKAFRIVFLFVILLFTSCENVKMEHKKNGNNNSSNDSLTLKANIEKLNAVFEKAMLAGDFESLLPYYTDDIIIVPDLKPPVIGKEAIREIYKKNKNLGLKYHSFSGTTEDVWECKDKIYERGKFGMSMSSNDHPKPVAYYGSYFNIWQKEKNSIKLKYLIWNFDFNPFK